MLEELCPHDARIEEVDMQAWELLTESSGEATETKLARLIDRTTPHEPTTRTTPDEDDGSIFIDDREEPIDELDIGHEIGFHHRFILFILDILEPVEVANSRIEDESIE